MLKKSLFVALCAGLAVTVFAATPQSVEDALMQTTGLKADAVQKSPVPGMWEVVVQDRVFYVDDQARYVLYGSLIDTVKQTNLRMNVFASGLASAGRNGRFRMLSNRSSARVSARLSSSPTPTAPTAAPWSRSMLRWAT